jgi:hypothetical protein
MIVKIVVTHRFYIDNTLAGFNICKDMKEAKSLNAKFSLNSSYDETYIEIDSDGNFIREVI